jgi:hypothetical protein
VNIWLSPLERFLHVPLTLRVAAGFKFSPIIPRDGSKMVGAEHPPYMINAWSRGSTFCQIVPRDDSKGVGAEHPPYMAARFSISPIIKGDV